jgi:hypothetical protein
MLYAKSWEHLNADATLFHPLYGCFCHNVNRFSWSGIICYFRTSFSCEPLYATETSHRKREMLIYAYPLHSVLLPIKNAQQNAAVQQYTPQTRSSFWLLKPASEHAHARLLPRLSWSWTVLLPSDTHRKTITSITAVLLPFLTYLLTLPRTIRVMKSVRSKWARHV